MKKILALVLALTMVAAMAACTPANNDNETVAGPASALELLNTVWAKYPEANKFPVMGGDAENPNWEGPGSVTLPGAEGNALWNLNISEERLPSIAEAATMIHAMNTNTFAGCALKLVEGADEAAVAKGILDDIQNTRWMCGFPERVVVVSTNGCLVVAFGLEMNITNLLTAIQAVDANANVLHNEVIG